MDGEKPSTKFNAGSYKNTMISTNTNRTPSFSSPSNIPIKSRPHSHSATSFSPHTPNTANLKDTSFANLNCLSLSNSNSSCSSFSLPSSTFLDIDSTPKKQLDRSDSPSSLPKKSFIQRIEDEAIRISQLSQKSAYRGNALDRVVLNVGGMLYETTSDTLLKDEHSFFAAMWRHRVPGEAFWLDRDGNRFAHVLNFLRNGTLWLNDIPSLMALREEAVYFQLSQLQDLCEEKIDDIRNNSMSERDQLIHAVGTAVETAVAKSTKFAFRNLGSYSKDDQITFCMDEDF